MLGVISPWLFKHGHFAIPLVLDIFSTLSVKYKTSEISPKCYVTKLLTQFQHKHNYVVSITLQISGQGSWVAGNVR